MTSQEAALTEDAWVSVLENYVLRSPTCGPEGVERRNMQPAGTWKALPERGGMVYENFSDKEDGDREARRV